MSRRHAESDVFGIPQSSDTENWASESDLTIMLAVCLCPRIAERSRMEQMIWIAS